LCYYRCFGLWYVGYDVIWSCLGMSVFAVGFWNDGLFVGNSFEVSVFQAVQVGIDLVMFVSC
jgi:hypothetical protein